MKVTKDVVRQFETDQENHGTKTAIANVLWLQADEQMRDLGVTKVSTVYKRKKGKK